MSYDTLKAKISQLVSINALIGGTPVGRAGDTLQFTAAESVGSISEYVWDFGDGNRASGVTVSNTYAAEGNYTLMLRITGTDGGTSITTTSVSISAVLIPITVNHNGPFDAVEDVETSLSATIEGDGIAAIECDPGDGSGYLSAPGGTLLHTYTTTVGSPFTVTFRVTDTEETTYTDSTTCTVAAAGTSPIASTSGPYTTTVGAPVQLSAQGSYTPGYPGDISVVKWEIDYGAGLVTINSAWSPTITPTVAEGPIDVTLTVTNSFGLTDTEVTTLTVNAATGSEIPDWLDDAPDVGAYDTELSIPVGGTSLASTGFPRSTGGAMKSLPTTAQAACFNLANATPWWYDEMETARGTNDSLILGKRFNTQECLDQNDANPSRGPKILAFTQDNSIDLTRTGGSVPSAFMLYGPSVTITNTGANNTNDAITFTVSTYSGVVPFRVNEYVVVRDSQADWSNAEHMRVTGLSGTTVTVSAGNRAYLSTKRAHPSGSIIAMHKRGNGGATNYTNHVWNMSTACPTVGGMQCWEFKARWYAAWYKTHPNGSAHSIVPEVLIDDSGFLTYWAGGSYGSANSSNANDRNCSCKNLGVADWGMDTNGDNLWGDGYESFVTLLASLITAGGVQTGVCGGDSKCGFEDGLGSEMELALDGASNENGTSPPIFATEFYGAFQNVLTHTPHSTGPCVTDLMSKVDPQAYPAAKRFNIAMSCWLHTFYSFLNGNRSFQWAQEGAVELDNANHGRCVASTDPTTILANINWLGAPTGRGKRVISDLTAVEAVNSVIANGDFSSTPVGSWSGTGGTLSWDEAKGHTSNGKSLRFSPNITASTASLLGSYVQAPAHDFVDGTDYTLCFVMDTEDFRFFNLTAGSLNIGVKPIIRPNKWNKLVFSWRQSGNMSGSRIRINVGSQNEDIWLDQFYLFEGVWAGTVERDFTNGKIVANGGPVARSSIPLGGTYEYLTNTGDDHALAGTGVTEVTIPAWDAAILVRESA